MARAPHRQAGWATVALIVFLACASLLAQSAGAATLTVSIDGFAGATGTVTAASGAIDCSGPPLTGSCSASFPAGAGITLQATPGHGSGFNGWLTTDGPDDCDGFAEICTAWMSSPSLLHDDRFLVASFAPSDSLGECGSGWARYIVVFEDFVEDPESLARAQVAQYGGTLGFIYKHALKGYSAQLPRDVVPELADEPTVKHVELDHLVTLLGNVSASGAPQASAGDGCGDEPALIPPPAEPEPQNDLGKVQPSHPSATGEAPQGPGTKGSRVTITGCERGKVHWNGRCMRKRALARRTCRARWGTVKPRCVRRTMRALTRMEQQRAAYANPD